MNVAVIGLGKMGSGIAQRLCNAGHTVYGFDTHAATTHDTRIIIKKTLKEAVESVSVVWLMVPVGSTVDTVLNEIMPLLAPHTIIVDGGNSNYLDSQKRAQKAADHALYYLDCGTSGGVKGVEHGFCLMIGGDQKAYEQIKPLCEAIAAPNGYGYIGSSGAGHYVKMIHNGIEYGLLQAYAEGFHLIKEGSFKDSHLDLAAITGIWQHGSVIRSWLLDMAHDIFKHDQQLDTISGEVAEGGTGAWTAEEAKKSAIPAPVIQASVQERARSRETGGNYATKVIALLRNAFGGHSVNKKGQQ